MKLDLADLFAYNNTMNIKCINLALKNEAKASPKIASLFSHILAAHHIWNRRILSEKAQFAPWQLFELKSWMELNEQNHDESQQILKEFAAKDQISYTNTKQISYTNSVSDILFHLINHSNYHRAQIASEFKACAIAPIVSDYIFFKR
jgi:uncharacterized damage-inducible protein DinB